ncbi:NnrS family protein [Pseudovibrio sp. WM33]|uniref:NnrS family protein n=1 Tax=Pseudovibrio sp. WM33 TaxID=1735585 RepID=UPI0007AE40D8|nr:NnrS family protein [Pseudovibrio sp. WM33]KZL23999.1 NnrS protein [Pseudovibrio sp. WM33]
MSTTMEQVRSWQGPVLFSYGFRPFFLASAVWAIVLMLLWIPLVSGYIELPIAFDPVSWHAHEFLFGYLSAVVAGFLLTAIPNWTGRMPIVGKPLIVLFSLWVIGRAAILFGAYLPASVVAALDVAMPLVLAIACLREIMAGKNWRNLIVLGLLGLLIASNLLFHWEAWSDGYAAQGYGMRLGISTMVLMVGLIGGRIIPSFTRNWLVKQGRKSLPASPMQVFDKISLLALLVALLVWTALQDHWLAGVVLLIAGVLHFARLVRWKGQYTFKEPLVLVLHASYLFMPLGLLALGFAILQPDLLDITGAQHLLMAGVLGMMTLAVMTRATLGHMGMELKASRGATFLYCAMATSVLLRFSAGLFPDLVARLYDMSALAWILAFVVYVVTFGPLLAWGKK